MAEPQVKLQAPAPDVTYTTADGTPYLSSGDGTASVAHEHVPGLLASGWTWFKEKVGLDPVVSERVDGSIAPLLSADHYPPNPPAPDVVAEVPDTEGGFNVPVDSATGQPVYTIEGQPASKEQYDAWIAAGSPAGYVMPAPLAESTDAGGGFVAG